MSRTYSGVCVCNACSQAKPNMIEIYWASGNSHYCQECWPARRDYYEDEGGREAWKRVGNYYAPNDE